MADPIPRDDPYQARYLAHQKRKAQVLQQIMQERHSNRMFDNTEVQLKDVHILNIAAGLCPSSCDRQGIKLKLITDRDQKALLGGLLVGGVGWIHRAPAIFLLYGDPLAYKAGDEITYMPYLDAGVVIQQLSLTATALGLHCAYANPNIREGNKEHFFNTFFGGERPVYCGAFAFGNPHPDTTTADKERKP